ncbi:CorA family divalent cation transporter [Anaerococcus porci]|uniref:Magnesium transporter CorA n=1 Tax=Anaerococcus porci TaxID=2652269 RepID=A0A6N7VUS7_9FIRM|nr:CorA family divalent cation transporter [Anaerococcus porci]MDY3005548.1 CorA family divalent cation transporter [Anaerococcus porci]MSS78606.1 magnesium transporter CorA [Anaerococcus porci]
MDYIYKFDTDNGFEQTDISSFYDVIEDDDFYLMYLGKTSFIEFANTYDLDNAIIDLLLTDTGKKSYIAVEDNYTFIILEMLDIMGNLDTSDLIGFYIENNRLIIVDMYDRDQSTSEAFREILRKRIYARSPGRLLKYFITALINNHTKIFDQIKNSTAEIEDSIVRNRKQSNSIEIISDNRHKALNLYTSYERLLDTLEVLAENENEIFDDDDIKHLKSVAFRVERYSSNISYLSDYITNVKDSYTSKMDLSTNNTMKILTVVTTIFTPITVLTGWYGMNFENMPELRWDFGYLYVIILSILSVFICFYLFKKIDK